MFTCEAIEKAKPSDIEALAERLEPALAKAVRDLIKDHVASVDLDALEDAIKNGRTYQVMEIIGQVDPQKAQAVRDTLQNAVWAGGALAVAQAPVFNEARFAFNRLNPALITWLETYSLNLIREVNSGTVAAVRSALVSGMTKGVNPIQQARQIKQAVGLTERQAQSVRNYREFLETVHQRRSVARMGLGRERTRIGNQPVHRVDAKGKPIDGIEQWRLRDQRYDAAIKRAVENKRPLSPEQIDKMVDRYQDRYIKHRAETIARTESLRATNAGANETWRQAIAEGKVDGNLVRKLWRTAHNCCDFCKEIPKLNPKRGVPINQPFRAPKGESLMLAPAHPSCRCSVFHRLWEPEQLQDIAA